jgi:hypothetical protein
VFSSVVVPGAAPVSRKANSFLLKAADFIEDWLDRLAPDDETRVGHVETLVVEEFGNGIAFFGDKTK